MAYKAKFWDGSQWVDMSSSITDTSAFATAADVEEILNDFIDPYFLMGA